MSTILNAVIPIVALLFFGGALAFVFRALRLRSSIGMQAYDVARQETRKDMLVSFSRAAMLLILALILFGVYGLGPLPETAEPEATATRPAQAATSVPIATALPAAATDVPPSITLPPASPNPTNTLPPETPTSGAPETPDPTDTPESATAVVNSPNGLWLREAPGGTQELELVPDGAVLTLLPGREIANDLEWQQVRTLAGNVGWVAVEFIIYR